MSVDSVAWRRKTRYDMGRGEGDIISDISKKIFYYFAKQSSFA